MDDYEYDDRDCPKCGASNGAVRFRHCDVFGCDDGYIDEYEDDPINFAPGEEFSVCHECKGTGIVCWCSKCGADLCGVQLTGGKEHEDCDD